MVLIDDIKKGAKGSKELYSLNSQQAAEFLGMKLRTLEGTRLAKNLIKGKAVPPFFLSKGNTGHAHYWLTDLLRYKQISGSWRPIDITIAILIGPDFCAELGVPYPQTTQANMAALAPSPSLTMAGQLGISNVAKCDKEQEEEFEEEDQEESKPKRVRKAVKHEQAGLLELQRAGVRVITHHSKFASLHDFMMNAELDEEWLFCCPPDRRPYDAIVAIMSGPTHHDFKWLSLKQYLRQTGKMALEEQRIREALEERAAIDPGKKKEVK